MAVVYTQAGAKLSYDAEEIDALLAKIESAKNIKRNLIVNPFFQINQRGKTAYTASGAEFTLDMWQALRENISFDTDGRAIIENPYGANGVMRQHIEDYSSLVGKTVTLSLDVDVLSVPAGTNVRLCWVDGSNSNFAVQQVASTGRRTMKGTFTVSSSFRGVSIYLATSSTSAVPRIKVYGIKLEIGSVSTLADDEPAYEEDLLRCQRYLYVLTTGANTNQPMAFGVVLSANTARISVPTPVPLRSNPTMDASWRSGFYVNAGNANHTITGETATALKNMIFVSVTTTGLTQYDICAIWSVGGDPNDNIVFSAEL